MNATTTQTPGHPATGDLPTGHPAPGEPARPENRGATTTSAIAAPANDDRPAASSPDDPARYAGTPDETTRRRPSRGEATTRARLHDLLRAFGLGRSADRRVEAAFGAARPANDLGRGIERVALADRFADAFETPPSAEPGATPRLRKSWLWRVDPEKVEGDAYDEEMRRRGLDPSRLRILRRLWRANVDDVEALRPELEAAMESTPGLSAQDRARLRELAAEVAALPPDDPRRDELLSHLQAMLAETPARRLRRLQETLETVVPLLPGAISRATRAPDRGPGGAPPSTARARSPEELRRLQDDLRSLATKQPIARRNAEAFERLYPDGPPDPRIRPELVGHVLYGEINEAGKAVGAHFGGRFADPAHVRIAREERLPNGVVRATIEIKAPDGRWIRKEARTTPFPDTADPARVLAEAVAALPPGGSSRTYRSPTPTSGAVAINVDYRGGIKSIYPAD